MHPAFSVIFFTTATGAGYGLLAVLGVLGGLQIIPADFWLGLVGLGLALGLIAAGLLSSTGHLGRPERGWRAFSQWRSSWLSREGVASVITYPIALAFGAVWSGLIDMPSLIGPLGLLTALMCAVTVYCTSMIYRQLKTIPAWDSRFTVPTYFFFALATGSSLLSVISVIFGRFQAGAGNFQSLLTVILIFICILLKMFYWRALRRAKARYTMGQATGLGEGVRQWEVPHTAENFIMKEMGYQVARNHARRLQNICAILLDVAFVLTLFTPYHAWLTFLVAPVLLLAAWVERWLFFAQAEHVVGLFYGKPAV